MRVEKEAHFKLGVSYDELCQISIAIEVFVGNNELSGQTTDEGLEILVKLSRQLINLLEGLD